MDNKPVFTLPPYKVVNVVSTLSQTKGWGITQCNIPNTWTVTKGQGETALIIDTGFTNHKDLVGAMDEARSRCFTDDNNIHDKQGHSSHCAGIVGARNNDMGMVGVAPESTIITAKALGDNGQGQFDWIVAALKYAKEIKPSVVSMSLGAPVGTQALHDAIKDLYKMNIPVIAAAGNEGTAGMGYPAMYPETIAIGAFDKNGNIAGFSSIGERVDFASPGVDIYSTYLNNTYCNMSGTSMATPFMTGVVLLLLAKHRAQEQLTGENDCRTVEQIRDHLRKYAIDKGYVGKDNQFGYGIIDVEKLILEADSVPTPLKPKPPVEKLPWYKKIFKWFK